MGGHIDFDAEAALADQVAFLVEQPTAVLGSFNPDYLDLPEEILTGVMRKHQRYFPVRERSGSLMPNFVAIANGPIDVDAVREGNEAVLRARFEDAAFFYRADLKTPIEQMQQRLERLSFAERLGSVADRAGRIRAIATDLSANLPLTPDDRDTLAKAAGLVKFDLGSQMVTEMTSLAGTMARTFAIEAGQGHAVAQALFETELPRSAGDQLPQSSAGAVLAFSDRLDFFTGLGATIGMPTGSKDPFALRRAALGIIALHRASPVLGDVSLAGALHTAAAHQPVEVGGGQIYDMTAFLRDRLAQQLIDERHRHDLIEAVMPFSDRPAFAASRLKELESLVSEQQFQTVAAALQRVSRILPAGTSTTDEFGLLITSSERRLIDALGTLSNTEFASDTLSGWVDRAAGLAEVVGDFFDEVLVMDPDLEVRAQRLGLLASIDHLAQQHLDWKALQL